MGQRKKSKPLTKVATQLPDELYSQVKEYVARKGTKVQTVFAEALREYIREHDR